MDISTQDDTRLAHGRKAKGGCFKYVFIGFGFGIGFCLAIFAMATFTFALKLMTGTVDSPDPAVIEELEELRKR